MKDFVVSKEINYIYMTLSQNKFILSNLSITMKFSKCEKTLCFLYKDKKHLMAAFIKNK